MREAAYPKMRPIARAMRFAYDAKYGFRDQRGGASSARETDARGGRRGAR